MPSGTSSTWAERCELSPCFTHTRVDGISSPWVAPRSKVLAAAKNRGQRRVLPKMDPPSCPCPFSTPAARPPADLDSSSSSYPRLRDACGMEATGTPSPVPPFWPPVFDQTVGASGNGTSADPEISSQGLSEVKCVFIVTSARQKSSCIGCIA